tara:strand:+ start:21183 stop:21353 length:171 start_codon:yes stop_codon:yes gene_type:complete
MRIGNMLQSATTSQLHFMIAVAPQTRHCDPNRKIPVARRFKVRTMSASPFLALDRF